jgi:FlaA1/EpsC-like NDP-sugar epimerase
MKKGFLDFTRDQCTDPPPVATAELTGQTVIITGANAGLGFEAAKHFARMKPGKLILACRSEERGNAAVESEFLIALLWWEPRVDLNPRS